METQEKQLWITDDHQSVRHSAPPMNICRIENGQEVKFCVFLILLPWQPKAARDTNHNGTKKVSYIEILFLAVTVVTNTIAYFSFCFPMVVLYVCMYIFSPTMVNFF